MKNIWLLLVTKLEFQREDSAALSNDHVGHGRRRLVLYVSTSVAM